MAATARKRKFDLFDCSGDDANPSNPPETFDKDSNPSNPSETFDKDSNPPNPPGGRMKCVETGVQRIVHPMAAPTPMNVDSKVAKTGVYRAAFNSGVICGTGNARGGEGGEYRRRKDLLVPSSAA
jgi:hypothetical protein